MCQQLHGEDTSVSLFWGHQGAFPTGGSCLMLMVWSHERRHCAEGSREAEVGELGGNSPTGKGRAARMGQAGLSPKSWSQPQPWHPCLQLTV